MAGKEVTADFFARNTLAVARDLLGKFLVYGECGGIIVETEAYREDLASHFIQKPRQAMILKETFGYIYIFLIYGVYFCLNFTTEKQGVGAVLIRALEPTRGIEWMRKRRKQENVFRLTSGPGKLCQALSIGMDLSGKPIGDRLKIYEEVQSPPVQSSPRIGISKAKDLDWRFFISNNPFVSRR